MVKPAQPGPPRPKIAWRRVDGLLLLDKPIGISSNDALQKARRIVLAEKGGHTGTLDPMASGLLPLCFGEATKFSHDLFDADKTYCATVRLGERTTTGDAEGVLIETRAVCVSAEQIRSALLRFVGPITQIPPMYSALKRAGVPLYKLARQGVEVERDARHVVVHELEMLRCDLPEKPQFEMRVRCSKGTYIRTLAEDIGAVLGCGAHLTALRRVAVGRLNVVDAVTLEGLAEAVSAGSPGALLQPPDSLLAGFPSLSLEGDALLRFAHGNPVAAAFAADVPPGRQFRVYAGDLFLGLGESIPGGRVQPRRLLCLAGDLPHFTAPLGGDPIASGENPPKSVGNAGE